MFNIREFVKKGFLAAVGHMAEFQVRLNAAAWLEKGVLTEDDLVEIDALLAAHAAAEAEAAENEVVLDEDYA